MEKGYCWLANKPGFSDRQGVDNGKRGKSDIDVGGDGFLSGSASSFTDEFRGLVRGGMDPVDGHGIW